MSGEYRQAARAIAGTATSDISWEPVAEGTMSLFRRLVRGLRAREQAWIDDSQPDKPWRDTRSANRSGWRERAAFLNGSEIFAVDYQICLQCELGWIEEPYTDPEFQRCGLAGSALAALRDAYSGLSWHTLGGHLPDSRAFWSAVGADVLGGYSKRDICPHQTSG